MKLIVIPEVDIFIASLEKSTRAKWIRYGDLLVLYDAKLGMPHVRRMGSDISELRIRGSQEVRVFFTCRKNSIVMLHAFLKKTQKTPQHELEIAQRKLRLLTYI